MNIQKRFITLVLLVMSIYTVHGYVFIKHDEHEKPKNLKILPKDISADSLHHVMREYSRALGVRCSFCHEKKEGQEHADFASEVKKEKTIAREMMLMVDQINSKYLGAIGEGKYEKITCVTCHMGRKVPIISVDSLPKKSTIAPSKLVPNNKVDSTSTPTKSH